MAFSGLCHWFIDPVKNRINKPERFESNIPNGCLGVRRRDRDNRGNGLLERQEVVDGVMRNMLPQGEHHTGKP